MSRTVAVFVFCIAFVIANLASASAIHCADKYAASSAAKAAQAMQDMPCHAPENMAPDTKNDSNGENGSSPSDCCNFMMGCGSQVVAPSDSAIVVAVSYASLNKGPSASELMTSFSAAPPTEPPKTLR